MGPRPVRVCLCGSTRFYEAFQRANYEETMAGRIVLTVGFYPHAEAPAHGQERGCTPEQKVALDELHKRKIDLADEILVLNVPVLVCHACQKPCEAHPGAGSWSKCCGAEARFRPYVGDSTRGEIDYAQAAGKRVRWLHPPG